MGKAINNQTQNSTFSKVAIIILNWNGWKDTIECLESVFRIDYPNYQVIVVDNGSTDESLKKITNWCAQEKADFLRIAITTKHIDFKYLLSLNARQIGSNITHRLIIIELDENVGFCAGNNLGLKLAYINNIPYAIILNNDTIVEKNFVFPLVEYVETHPDVGLIGGQIRYAYDRNRIWWAGGKFSFWLTPKYLFQNELAERIPVVPYQTEWISGCMTFIPLFIFSKVGGYNELFFIWCDEWDLSLRIEKAGYKLMVIPSSIIYHKIGKTLGKISPLTYYYSGRNLLFYRHTYLPFRKQFFFFVLYIPYKFFQSISYTIRFKDIYFIYFWDVITDFIFNRFGKWRRHDIVASKMRVQ